MGWYHVLLTCCLNLNWHQTKRFGHLDFPYRCFCVSRDGCISTSSPWGCPTQRGKSGARYSWCSWRALKIQQVISHMDCLFSSSWQFAFGEISTQIKQNHKPFLSSLALTCHQPVSKQNYTVNRCQSVNRAITSLLFIHCDSCCPLKTCCRHKKVSKKINVSIY